MLKRLKCNLSQKLPLVPAPHYGCALVRLNHVSHFRRMPPHEFAVATASSRLEQLVLSLEQDVALPGGESRRCVWNRLVPTGKQA